MSSAMPCHCLRAYSAGLSLPAGAWRTASVKGQLPQAAQSGPLCMCYRQSAKIGRVCSRAWASALMRCICSAAMSNLSSKVIALTSILFFFNGTSHNAADRAFQLAGIHDAGKGEGHIPSSARSRRNGSNAPGAAIRRSSEKSCTAFVRMARVRASAHPPSGGGCSMRRSGSVRNAAAR